MLERFVYDETSFSCLRLAEDTRRQKAGDAVGSIDKKGYIRVAGPDRKAYYAHRIVWMLHNGLIQKGLVTDHIDGNPSNNRIENLRVVTPAINSRNRRISRLNPSGKPGLYFRPNGGVRAEYTDKFGRRCRQDFSIKELGEEGAVAAALKFRADGLALVEGYTERHKNGST
jgi:hypothetical protein